MKISTFLFVLTCPNQFGSKVVWVVISKNQKFLLLVLSNWNSSFSINGRSLGSNPWNLDDMIHVNSLTVNAALLFHFNKPCFTESSAAIKESNGDELENCDWRTNIRQICEAPFFVWKKKINLLGKKQLLKTGYFILWLNYSQSSGISSNRKGNF